MGVKKAGNLVSAVQSVKVMSWDRRVEVQRAQKELMEATKDNKEFNEMKRHEQENNTFNKANQADEKCKYYGNSHEPR